MMPQSIIRHKRNSITLFENLAVNSFPRDFLGHRAYGATLDTGRARVC
jgi:hypothetical protein